ncbi:MAG: hypothetical protein Q8922_11360 [Bacteroidota bacterium]|nr:hypothetical protein [Bacteroidota bacterium]MDP4233596.1 hypothetical protein [Bacteroidota bacterium]MDP4244089.1 hypothetical protein [Bacteroidota bacterium]MDP4288524.1 hypothetical protein [Bacteroidota bacterium]
MKNSGRSYFRWLIPTSLIVLLASGSLIATRAHSSLAGLRAQTDSVNYQAMSHTEKKEYMRDVLTPEFARMFTAFDAKRFPTVKCVTCHGNGARTGEFKMPDEKLPKLPRSEAGMKRLEKKMPAIVRFMRDSVATRTASLLGVKEYKCEGCHVMK